MQRESVTWNQPAQWPRLSKGEVHVWLADAREWQAEEEAFTLSLAPDEIERLGRFRTPEQKSFYRTHRGLLRLLLGRYLGEQPERVRLSYGAHGKPELADPEQLFFNLSHSGDFAVFAFTQDGPVGVDIERCRGQFPRMIEIAQRQFAPGEVETLKAIPAELQLRAFFRCWTQKEAFIKARGDGVFGGLDTFEVDVDGEGLKSIQGDHSATQRWTLRTLPLPDEFVGAVAVAAPRCSMRLLLAKPGLVVDKK